MNLLNALELDTNSKNIICLIGAGGKTTTMYSISKELIKQDKKVLLTTTTAIYYPMSKNYDNLIISNDLGQLILESKRLALGSITIIGKTIFYNNEKLKGIDRNWVKPLCTEGNYDSVIIECDGAKRKSIKAPTWYEPVIPKCATLMIGCIGLDIIDKMIDEKWVHRANIFSGIVNQKLGERINYDTILKLILSKDGLFKECNKHIPKVVLLNKVFNEEQLLQAQKLAENIINESNDISKVLIGNVKEENPILTMVEDKS
ncbi:hydroxylase accessory protein YqeC [Vallitalea longa]|uniref:Hydroxylase accessory protein YqeC n=1 Tax=Vallitalea longa TaxID=2936439 RepID=A0A9W5Y9Y6_9FIRM|nr:selenium cofactor biosynthesis protein YqeC [Vallitalea longa]GKX30037.1 hydroxylase accessory protein YqeC [Vallitalea longa]